MKYMHATKAPSTRVGACLKHAQLKLKIFFGESEILREGRDPRLQQSRLVSPMPLRHQETHSRPEPVPTRGWCLADASLGRVLGLEFVISSHRKSRPLTVECIDQLFHL
jgi:hypothetical protein